jgi:hypothetical protein
MAGSMSRADLVLSLRESLMDAASSFADNDADFERHIDVAAADMHRVRPRTLIGELSLVADQGEYAAPVDMARFKSALWGVQGAARAMPWDKNWLGELPRPRCVDGFVSLLPAPSARQIALLGSTYRFYYVAKDSIGTLAADTTISADHRHILLLRAQAEAMLDLAMRDSVRPVQVGGGFGQQAKTGTPAALRESLMADWLAWGLR